MRVSDELTSGRLVSSPKNQVKLRGGSLLSRQVKRAVQPSCVVILAGVTVTLGFPKEERRGERSKNEIQVCTA